MFLPFLSFSWVRFSGQFAMPAVRIVCDVTNAGQYCAPYLRARSKGKRVVMFQNAELLGQLFNHPADLLPGNRKGLWWPNGIAATKAQFGTVVEQLWANKADLDYAAFDVEGGVSAWNTNQADMAAIYADPRWAGLVASGRFPADPRGMSWADVGQFNYGCQYLCSQAIVQAMITPLYKRYNGLNWSNFGDAPITKADAAYVVDPNGNSVFLPTTSATVTAPVVYGYVGNLGTNDPRFKEPFYAVCWMSNNLRATCRAVENTVMTPWVAPRVSSNVLDNAWWIEHLFHTCVISGPNLLYFNGDDYTTITNWRFDNALAQYVGMARGKEWVAPLTTDLVRYDTAKFIHTACKLADGKTLGRVSFKPGVNSATFAVSGKTFTVKRPDNAVGAWFHS